ncbi:hypothetical protein [Saccharospirillum salsuginis]|uniref:Uncharacterized protein n=1 Tax=Saccharospirillum salsuginis TaxID=418750 RepID=A0A918NKG9_9GAMM|nr:hypothetical protein [Saccharospirillum salsuginis]GGX75423.1 hypothetical protein GCM10007392_48220 [Saccharospirillum salsuginis]
MSPLQTYPADPPSTGWLPRASRLSVVLKQIESADIRIAVLKRLSERMDDPGYPGLIKLLMIVAESDDRDARRRLADTLGIALQRLDLPTGELTAWGSGSNWNDLAIEPGNRLNIQALSSTPVRRFGPIEYLVVWYCQKTQRPYLSQTAYLTAVRRLVELINHSEAARRLYPAKILSDLDHGREGNYSRRSRASLAGLARAWEEGRSPGEVAEAGL